jgi:hypothetical protein
MSDEERIAKLTELAKRVWWPDINLVVRQLCGAWLVESETNGEELLSVVHGERGLDALEAALLALAKEPPQWALELADQWRAQADYPDREDKRTLESCADELLTVAKGQPT